jgi:hypothetical protein
MGHMGNDSMIIEALRAARGEVDLITKLKEGSLETRRERLAEALRDETWIKTYGGAAELIATYPHHVVARKDGVLMRVQVTEDEKGLTLGKAEIFSIPMPAEDVGSELMATAQSAAEFVLKEDFESATPLIRGIAATLDVKGDLHRRLSMAVQLKSLGRKTWWQETISEQFAAKLDLPATDGSQEPTQAAAESLDRLLTIIKESAVNAVAALKTLSEASTKNEGAIECASDIAEDLNSAVSILNGVNRDDLEETTRVFEEVSRVVPRLLAGINFLTHLTKTS